MCEVEEQVQTELIAEEKKAPRGMSSWPFPSTCCVLVTYIFSLSLFFSHFKAVKEEPICLIQCKYEISPSVPGS